MSVAVEQLPLLVDSKKSLAIPFFIWLAEGTKVALRVCAFGIKVPSPVAVRHATVADTPLLVAALSCTVLLFAQDWVVSKPASTTGPGVTINSTESTPCVQVFCLMVSMCNFITPVAISAAVGVYMAFKANSLGSKVPPLPIQRELAPEALSCTGKSVEHTFPEMPASILGTLVKLIDTLLVY